MNEAERDYFRVLASQFRHDYIHYDSLLEHVESLIAAERERCIKPFEDLAEERGAAAQRSDAPSYEAQRIRQIVAAIRARSTQPTEQERKGT